MLASFKNFVVEAVEPEGEKLTHIEHLEDHPIKDGAKGFEHAIGALHHVHQHIIAGKKDPSISMKHDGSPSLVYGHHPENKKFFVASKSAFNKTPKVNYTDEDIDKNHGHAPGLAKKLKSALQHLPKVAPKTGVFHGDVLFSGPEDKEHSEDKSHVKFRPNTITYSADKSTPEGKKAHKAKFGLYTHTQYDGKTSKSMNANYNPDTSGFRTNVDVYHRHGGHDMSMVKMMPREHEEFEKHVASAKKLHDTHGSYVYDALPPIKNHFSSYINHTVKTQEAPSVAGMKKHIEGKYTEAMDQKKLPDTKKKYQSELTDLVKHMDLHKHNIHTILKIHDHLSQAKNTLVNVMSKHDGGLKHEINGKKTKPEGFVVAHKGKLSKLTDRNEFNRLNFASRKK